MNSIFALTNEDLGRLNAERSVHFFQSLVWAECRRLGLATSAANISSRVTVPDGGVDARITRESVEPNSSLAPNGLTCFQLKTGTSFHPWQPAALRNELFGTRDPSRDNLGESIRRCLDEGGRYVLVCFGVDPTEPQIKAANDELRRLLTECGYTDPKVAVWGQNTLLGLSQQFPSLALDVKGLDLGTLQTHSSWSNNGEMAHQLETSSDYDGQCEAVRRVLRTADRARHLRIVDEAGGGKSRFVLEATRADDIAPLVIYGESPAAVEDLLGRLCLDDNDSHVVLIVDDCDVANSTRLWNRLQNRGSRLKLITISHLQGASPPGVEEVALPALGRDEIKAIIQGHLPPNSDVERWAQLAGSSPRFAHLIGQNLHDHPEDPLSGTDQIFDRIVGGSDAPGSEGPRRRRCVLRHLALFAKFGYEEPVASEGRAIAELVREADGISDAQFHECVKWLRDQRILQGDRTLYITPKGLHVQMWREYWDTYGAGFDVEAFLARIEGNHDAQKWFFEMFKYAAHSQAAKRVVQGLIGPNGPFEKSELLRTELGAHFFLALTEADPREALSCLKRTVGKWSRKELRGFTDGRQWIVWSLERTAIWKDLFEDSARLLLALGEEENASNANNASGMFAELFSLAPGKVAPTEADPADRLPIIGEALDSTSPERRALGLRACRSALQLHSGGRFVGAEYQGLKQEPQLWLPATYGDWAVAIRGVWELLVARLDTLSDEEQREAVGILLETAHGLHFLESLSDMVLGTFQNLASRPYVPRKELLRTSLDIRQRSLEAAHDDLKERWRVFCEELTGSGFSAELRRYVGMSMFEDEYDDKGERTGELESKIAALADQAVVDLTQLELELTWLISESTDNAYRFGYELAARDMHRQLIHPLLAAQREAGERGGTNLLAGYLRKVFEQDQAEWDTVLRQVETDTALRPLLAELVWRSGMTEQAARLVLSAVKDKEIPETSLRMFAFGRVLDAMSEDLLADWVDYLLECKTREAAYTALDLLVAYYRGKATSHPPEQRLRGLVLHDSFFRAEQERISNSMQLHNWTAAAQLLLKHYPNHAPDLARLMLRHLHEPGTVVSSHLSTTIQVLNDIVVRDPEASWAIVAEHIEFPLTERTFRIQQWLRGHNGGGTARLFDVDTLLAWASEDVDNRAWFLASVASRTLSGQGGIHGLARELLVRHGTRKDVRSSLYANWMTETWNGLASTHYRDKKAELEKVRKNETDKNVRDWIDETLSSIDRQIEDAVIREEREAF